MHDSQVVSKLMRQVRAGMRVVDAHNDDVGTVDEMSMGDPEAVTTAGNEPRATGGLMRDIAEAISVDRPEPDVPDPLRSRLLREGYLKVKRGPLGGHVYVSGEQLARTDGDRVVLRVARDDLNTA